MKILLFLKFHLLVLYYLQIIGDSLITSLVHSNFIINNGEATALDIENLGKKIIKQVQEKFGIRLEWEIKIIGT